MSALKSKKTLKFSTRESLGGSSPRRVRRTGFIPAVVYSDGKREQQFVAIEQSEFSKKFKKVSENELISLVSDNKEIFVLIKNYQYDPLASQVSHIDFYEVFADKKVRTSVPIVLTGSPKGIRDGGVLQVSLRQLSIECLPQDLPEEISIDISNLDRSHSVKVSDLTGTSVRILTKKEQTIASVLFQTKS